MVGVQFDCLSAFAVLVSAAICPPRSKKWPAKARDKAGKYNRLSVPAGGLQSHAENGPNTDARNRFGCYPFRYPNWFRVTISKLSARSKCLILRWYSWVDSNHRPPD